MFLTRFTINPRRRAARDLLGSPQRMHAAIAAAFPDDLAEHRTLWRLDERTHDVALYLVSVHKPDLHHLSEQVGRPVNDPWETRDYTPLLGRLAEGQTWAFRLRANPVHHARVKADERPKRLAHVTVTQQTDWFLARAERHGFDLAPAADEQDALIVRDRRTLRFGRAGHTVTLGTAVFEGTLVVRDVDALRTALTSGIGKAKGYGCGLMTLAGSG